MLWPHVGHVDHAQQPGSGLRHVTRGWTGATRGEVLTELRLAELGQLCLRLSPPGLRSPLYTVSAGRWLGLQWLITTFPCW